MESLCNRKGYRYCVLTDPVLHCCKHSAISSVVQKQLREERREGGRNGGEKDGEMDKEGGIKEEWRKGEREELKGGGSREGR